MRPLRAGKKRRNRGTLTRWQINMARWVDGEWEEVWEEACEIEKQRRAAWEHKLHKSKSTKPEEELMKKWLRVKRLVNDGELSKAARDIDGAGVAEPTEKVIAE